VARGAMPVLVARMVMRLGLCCWLDRAIALALQTASPGPRDQDSSQQREENLDEQDAEGASGGAIDQASVTYR